MRTDAHSTIAVCTEPHSSIMSHAAAAAAAAASSHSAAAASSPARSAAANSPISVDSDDDEDAHAAPDSIDDLVDLEQMMEAEAEQAAAEEAGGFDPAESGGGFFTEEQTAAGAGAAEASAVESLDEDKPANEFASGCRECGSIGVQQNYLTAFNVSVCFRCQRAHPDRYKLLTQTSCTQTYMLPLQMVQSRLGFIEKKNPHKHAWGSMKLYWKQQVLALVREKWGTMEALEAAKQARDMAKITKDDAKRRQAHRTAAREAAFTSTLAASMGELDAQTPTEVVAMLAARTKGMGAGAGAARPADKKRKGKGKKQEADAEQYEEVEFDPLAALPPAARKRAKKEDAAKATAKLHVHSFVEEATGKKTCTECGFVIEFESF